MMVPRADDLELRQFVFQCCWHYSMGVSVEEIANATRRSRPTIYRALEHGREWGWLDDSPRLVMPRGRDRAEVEQGVADFEKANQVRDVFGRDARPTEVIVVPSPPESPEERLAAAVCRAMREAEPYQEAAQKVDIDWEQEIPAIAEIVAAAERVRALGAGRDAVRDIVARYIRRPFTARDMERSRRVGRAGALRFCQAIEDGVAQSVGLAWGFHVRDFTEAVTVPFPAYAARRGAAAEREENARRIHVFPVIGSLGLDPLVDTRGQGHVSGAHANCAALAERLGAEAPVALTQPARIPEAFHTPAELRRIWTYVEADLSVKLVFGPDLANRRLDEDGHPRPDPAEGFTEPGAIPADGEGYLGRADTLVTGIGTCATDSRAPRIGVLSAAELAVLEKAGAAGDIAGYYFWDPSSPPSEADKAIIRATNSRTISPRLADFVSATQRARTKDDGTIGTMVLASGAQKAEPIKCLCRWRAVNVLVVDSELADAIISQQKGP